MPNIPYWRLSAFYFFYFGSLGTLVPYWGLYLQELGFDAQTIGELMAMMVATRIVASILWGWWADHTGQHITWVRLSALLATFCFLGVLFDQSYVGLAVSMGAFSFFWNATLPQFEAVTFAHLGEQFYRYPRIRLWGSIGFILTVTLFGWLFNFVSILVLPSLLLGLFANIWLTSCLVPEKLILHRNNSKGSFFRVLKQPAVIALFVVCFLVQVSHGPYYTFYSIYLEQHGYRRDVIGQFWALGVIAEIGIFLIMHRLLKYFHLRTLLIISLSFSGLRWILIGYGVQWGIILWFAQWLHAASFALYHSVAMQWIRHYFIDAHQGRAQALYSSLGFGAGGAIGSFLSGYLWEKQGPTFTFLSGSLLCGIAIGISWQWVGRK